ncbi:MAG: integrase [Candidatus Bathyarchaeota archaeon]
MNPRLPECKASSYTQIDWDMFIEWLSKDHAKNTVGDMLRNSTKYCYILENPSKASNLLNLSKDSRRVAMSSLANLSKFLGVYEYWRQIVRNAGLKWENRSPLEAVMSILNAKISDTKPWLKEALQTLPRQHGVVLLFDALTGLRPQEAAKSCRLISELTENGKLNEYLNEEIYMLEHFKYQELFLRKCKNAYISFVTPELLEVVKSVQPKITYEAIDSGLNRNRLAVRTKELRKLYATLLREHMPQELVDLLQGRVSQSVFLRFYYKPLLSDVREKVLKAITPL